MRNLSLTFYVMSVFALFFSGCTGGHKEDRSKKESSKDSVFTQKNASLKDKKEVASVKNVFFYLECSGSMKGFVHFPGKPINPEFKNDVTAFSSFLVKKMGNNGVKFATVTDGKIGNSVEVDKFNLQLTKGTVFNGQDTPLDRIISDIIKQVDSQQTPSVGILLTDGVLSFHPVELVKDRMKNIQNQSVLKSAVRDALINTKNITMALVKYESLFNGSYYYDCKGLKPFDAQIMEHRPYYYFVIGKGEYVSQIVNNSSIWPKGKREIFMLTDMVNMEAAIFLKSKVPMGAKAINEAWVATSGKVKKTFYIGVNVFDFPESLVNKKTEIMRNLKSNSSIIANIKPIDKQDVNNNLTKGKLYASIDDYEYFYEIELKDNAALSSCLSGQKYLDIQFYIEPIFTLDMQKTATDNDYDKEVKNMVGKTWGLNLVTEAIQEAKYSAEAPRMGILLIKLKTK